MFVMKTRLKTTDLLRENHNCASKQLKSPATKNSVSATRVNWAQQCLCIVSSQRELAKRATMIFSFFLRHTPFVVDACI